jgi:hypothetical protein
VERLSPAEFAAASREAAESRAVAAARRLSDAEERLAVARTQLAAAENEREKAAHQREIDMIQRALVFHRQAIEDQREAASLMERRREIDQAASDAGSMSAVVDERHELLVDEAEHQRRVQAHAALEKEAGAQAARALHRDWTG